MDIEKAKEKIEITPEEAASLKRYQGFWHTTINTLCDMNPDTINELSKSGWRMLETKDEIEQAIDDFVNIYSAMYKYSRGKKYMGQLVRGSGNKEAKRMTSKVNKFLSTTTSEEIAKTFTDYDDGAIIRISLNEGVPYIDMTPYKNQGSRDEHEILVAPFCEVSNNRMISNWQGYTYYSVGLNKPQLREIDEDKLAKMKESIINQFPEMLSLMQEYINYERTLESYEESYKRAKGNKEELKEILKEKSSVLDKINETYSPIYEFKTNIRELLEGICRQRELEIDEAKSIVEADDKKKQVEKNNPKNKIIDNPIDTESEREENADKTSKNSIKISGVGLDKLEKIYNKLSEKNATFETVAKTLQVPYNYGESIKMVNQKIDEIKSIANNLYSNNENQELVYEAIDELYNLCDRFEIDITAQIKEDVFRKSSNMIKTAKISQYKQQYQALSNKKVSFWGKLQGKEKLKKEQLRNLELRISGESIEEMPTAEDTNNFSIRNTLADLHIAINHEIGGQYNQELVNYYNTIKNVFGQGNKQFSDELIANIAQEKMSKNQNGLPAIDLSEGTRKQIAGLQTDNEHLQNVNAQKEKKAKDNFKLKTRGRKNPIEPMLEKLDRIKERMQGEQYYSQSKEEDKTIEI